MPAKQKPKRTWERASGTPESKALAMAVARKITETRLAKGITQDELAGRMGISIPSVCRLETGSRGIAFDRLAGFAAALECRVKDLVPDEAEWRPLIGNVRSKEIDASIQFHKIRLAELEAIRRTCS